MRKLILVPALGLAAALAVTAPAEATLSRTVAGVGQIIGHYNPAPVRDYYGSLTTDGPSQCVYVQRKATDGIWKREGVVGGNVCSSSTTNHATVSWGITNDTYVANTIGIRMVRYDLSPDRGANLCSSKSECLAMGS